MAWKRDREPEELTVKPRDICNISPAVGLQTIAPGESRIFSVWKFEVLHYNNPERAENTSARIGFEFFVGEERLKKIFWSEEITFPSEDELAKELTIRSNN